MKSVFTLALLAATALVGCSTAQHREPSSVSMPPTELGEVWGPENDVQTTKIVGLFQNMLQSEMKPGEIVRRDAHPKHHACVRSSLTIDNSQLATPERAGLYAAPGRYDAWIRFSNADPSGDAKNDYELDQRGMAVKILNVPGSETGNHDLVMMDSETFFSKDGENYLPMTEALLSGGAAMAKFFILHPHQASVLLASRHHVTSPLSIGYYSSVPYKLGDVSSRFTMQPCKQNDLFPKLPEEKTASKYYLRERLVKTLETENACFDLYVQPNRDPARNNVEDPTRSWDVTVSPMIHVGRLDIPKQTDETSQTQMNFCENISMDPWRTPSANRPLGQINRIRRLAYPQISAFRHAQNKRQRIEPRDLNPCSGETADLCQR